MYTQLVILQLINNLRFDWCNLHMHMTVLHDMLIGLTMFDQVYQ